MARKSTELRPLMLRLPEKLRAHLERAAAKADQSMNSEINQRLERSFTLEEELQRAHLYVQGLLDRDVRVGKRLTTYVDNLLKERGADDETCSYVTSHVLAYFAKDKTGEQS